MAILSKLAVFTAFTTVLHGNRQRLAPVSSVQNVISILKEMQENVSKNKVEGIKVADEQENECIAATTAGKAEIKRQTEIKEQSAARVEAAEANAASYNAEHRDLTTAIANKNEETVEKKAVYAEESTNIAKELVEMVDIRDMLVQAFQVLKRHMSFVQQSKGKGTKKFFLQHKESTSPDETKMKQILTGLSAIVNAAWVDNQSAKVIKKFLKDPAAAGPEDGPFEPEDEDLAGELHDKAPCDHAGPEGDEFHIPEGGADVPHPEGDVPATGPEDAPVDGKKAMFIQAPQATTSAYNAGAGTQKILRTISELQVKAEGQIDDLKKRQMETKHAYELYIQDSTALVESKTEQAGTAKNSATQASSSAQDAGSRNQQSTALLEDEVSKLREKESSCAKAAQDWADLKQEMEEEFSVLGQGIEILSGKFGADEGTSLVQIKKHIQRGSFNSSNPATSAASILRQLGEKFDNFGFVQAASKLDAGDPFAKVKDLVSAMITKLEEEQKAESNFEAECKANLKKGNSEKAKKETKLAQLQSRLKGHKAKHLSLDSQISETEARIQQIQEEQTSSTVVFNEQQKEDKAVVEEATSSIEALDQAIMTLQEFYGQKIMVTAPVSFAQLKKSEKGETVIKVLAQAQADFLQIKSKTEEKIRHDKSKYEEDSNKNALSLARHKTELQGKQSQKSETAVVIQEVTTDANNAEIELNAAVEYLAGINERCANKPMSFEERQERRGEEIAGLKTALEILSADTA